MNGQWHASCTDISTTRLEPPLMMLIYHQSALASGSTDDLDMMTTVVSIRTA